MVKQLTFQADPALVRHMIQSQAGTLSKAVLEGVMNSVDAGAPRIEVTITPTHVTIIDNGDGFKTAEEVELNFGIMGRPHAMGDDGLSSDARFGRFRIGRGQMFNFGVNDWYTNQFHLHVDFKAAGRDNNIGWSYTTHKEVIHSGCKVEIALYDPLGPSDIAAIERDLQKQCAYLDVEVIVNGKQVSVDPAKCKWDIVSDIAYIKRSKSSSHSGIDVYNDGVYVETISHWQAGYSGVVVARKQLVLNTARNQVMRNSAMWKRIMSAISGVALEKTKKEVVRTEAEAKRAFEFLAEGNLTVDSFWSVRAFVDVNGGFWSMMTIAAQVSSIKRRRFQLTTDRKLIVSFGRPGDADADALIQTGRALVFDESILQWCPWNNIKQLLDELRVKYVPFKELRKSLEEAQYDIVDDRMLRPTEYQMLHAMRLLSWDLRDVTDSGRCRDIFIGVSTRAYGWTDGAKYIAIQRSWLEDKLTGEIDDFASIVHLLIHECCHDTRSDTDHGHDEHFMKAFHDKTIQHAPRMIRRLKQAWEEQLRKNAKSPSRIKAIENSAAWRAAALAKVAKAEADGIAKHAAKVSEEAAKKAGQAKKKLVARVQKPSSKGRRKVTT